MPGWRGDSFREPPWPGTPQSGAGVLETAGSPGRGLEGPGPSRRGRSAGGIGSGASSGGRSRGTSPARSGARGRERRRVDAGALEAAG
eukprot:4251987-Alexandrium_andersonii.AAC.1